MLLSDRAWLTTDKYWVASEDDFNDYLIITRREVLLLKTLYTLRSLKCEYFEEVEENIYDSIDVFYKETLVYRHSTGISNYSYIRSSKYLYVNMIFDDVKAASCWLCLDPLTLELVGYHTAGVTHGDGFADVMMRMKEINFDK